MTLAATRDRVEQMLSDSGNAKYSEAALDEAIRQALQRLSARLPHRAIHTLTLSTAGREIDASSLAYTDVERVWWDYDSTDPTYPPNYREFEVWPGDIIFIADSAEPASGDVVRLWVTQCHTLNGLDAETVDTITEPTLTTLIVGAAGFAAQARALSITEQVNIDGQSVQRLSDWADAKLAQFEAQIDERVAQAGADASGLAATAPLDRWDVQGEW